MDCQYCGGTEYIRIANEPITFDNEDYHLESCPYCWGMLRNKIYETNTFREINNRLDNIIKRLKRW